MLPNNVVSFMKKIVKNDANQQESTLVPANKLTRLKQTLTTGLQQAQDSVAKFSPKSIHVGVSDITSRRLSSKEPSNEESIPSTDNVLDKDASNPTDPSSVLLHTSIGISSNKSSSGPPNRLTSCRVCVRSLSIGNSDVSYRLCSQCNLKVCEDCASYSNLDNDIDKTFWRCSVCRRRNQGATTPMLTTAGAAGTGVTRQPTSAVSHRWSEEKPGSLSTFPDDYNKRSKEPNIQTPGSAPVSRRERRSTSGESGILIDQKNTSAAQSLQTDSSRPSGFGNSTNNALSFNETRCVGSVSRTPSRKPSRLDQPHDTARSISASESSPEDLVDQQKNVHYDRDSGISSRRSTADIQPSEPLSRRSSCRQSFQKQMRDQSVYLSADDACLSRWNQQRRYSSESSDASETGGGAPRTPRRPSQEETDEVGCGYGTTLLPSTRRRLSFRSNRTRHFYDVDGSDSYEACEQSASDVISTNPSLMTDVGVSRTSRRSCSDISQLNISPEWSATTAAMGSQHGLHSPRGSIGFYDGDNEERHVSHRKISTQLSDPPPSLSRSQSPRPSIASSRGGSDRRSIEREAIRIVIDDVDCSSASNQVVTKTTTPNSSTVVTCLHRDSSYKISHDHGFTAGFGLTLDSRKNVLITWIDPHGPAARAGLCCGDIVLSWDGIELVGRNFEDVQEELQHSGDSIQIQVLRNPISEENLYSQKSNTTEDSHQQPIRPNKLTSSVLVLEAGSSGRSTPPSPTRRRLPQAPTASVKSGSDFTTSFIYRVQLKFKCSLERDGNVCMVITVLGADKSPTEEYNEENALGWIQMVLTLPSGASRKFVTDRTQVIYGLRWNSFFTCSDMTTEEVSRSQLAMSLWIEFFQRGETKLAESIIELQNIVMDSRPTWFPLRSCETAIYNPPRRLSKAVSHDLQNHQQPTSFSVSTSLNVSRNSSELSVDHISQSPPSFHQRTPTPPGLSLPRSRSAEICNLLLLQPEPPSWSTSGLSAPASLAPSRRGSSYNCEDDLQILRSSPSSRRGSSVFNNESEMPNIQLVHDKLSSTSQSSDLQHICFSSSQRRSQSFRTETKHHQHNLQDMPSNRIAGRIPNLSSLELGTGQIFPERKTTERNEGIFFPNESCGQIKLGLIITQGRLEIEVIAARNLPTIGENSIPPDTYVKVILCDEERVFCKRKTKTMRRNCHPEFHQTLLFEACNALGATLTIEMRLKDGIGSGKSLRRSSATSSSSNAKYSIASQQNQSTLGFAHIALDRLSLTTLTISWYRLIPVSLANIMGPSKLEDSS